MKKWWPRKTKMMSSGTLTRPCRATVLAVLCAAVICLPGCAASPPADGVVVGAFGHTGGGPGGSADHAGPFPTATIIFRHGNRTYRTTTSHSGRFRIALLPGTYTIRGSATYRTHGRLIHGTSCDGRPLEVRAGATAHENVTCGIF